MSLKTKKDWFTVYTASCDGFALKRSRGELLQIDNISVNVEKN